MLKVASDFEFDLISNVHKQRPMAHTGANRLTHVYRYILMPTVLYWMNNLLILKNYFAEFHNVFVFQRLLTFRSHTSVD